MVRNPRLNALRVFDVAARHLNFGSAADELNVTQGAVAQSIRGLEADLGISLFKRLPRGVALTDVGLRYHNGISKGLSVIDQATEELRTGANSITVSVPPSFASKWLVRRLPYFLEGNPDVEVRTVATEVVTDFQSQNVDVAVRQGAKPTSGELVAKAVAPIELVIVCGQSVSPLPDANVSMDWFADQTLIQDSHKHWTSLLTEHDLKPRQQFLSFNQTALAIDAAISGQGFVVVPKFIAEDDLATGRLIAVKSLDQDKADGFWVVHLNNKPPNGDARSSFIDWLLMEARN